MLDVVEDCFYLTSVIYQTNLLLVLKALNSVNENRLFVALSTL